MNIMKAFISEYGLLIIYTALTAIAGFIGAQIKRLYEKHINTERKRKVVETCVKAVEQLYRDLDGAEKLQKAKENILEMLTQEGIEITEIEMDMLIESVVAEFNYPFMSVKGIQISE